MLYCTVYDIDRLYFLFSNHSVYDVLEYTELQAVAGQAALPHALQISSSILQMRNVEHPKDIHIIVIND